MMLSLSPNIDKFSITCSGVIISKLHLIGDFWPLCIWIFISFSRFERFLCYNFFKFHTLSFSPYSWNYMTWKFAILMLSHKFHKLSLFFDFSLSHYLYANNFSSNSQIFLVKFAFDALLQFSLHLWYHFNFSVKFLFWWFIVCVLSLIDFLCFVEICWLSCNSTIEFCVTHAICLHFLRLVTGTIVWFFSWCCFPSCSWSLWLCISVCKCEELNTPSLHSCSFWGTALEVSPSREPGQPAWCRVCKVFFLSFFFFQVMSF